MRCEAQIARFGYSGAEFPRAYACIPKPVSTGVENGRGPVGDVKLVCLALWRKREYLTFISNRFVAFSNQNFADYGS